MLLLVLQTQFVKINSPDILIRDLLESSFAQSLFSSEFYFAFPPVGKAISAIKHFVSFDVAGVLILPIWPRSVWYLWFFPDGRHCASWVQRIFMFNPTYSGGLGFGTSI